MGKMGKMGKVGKVGKVARHAPKLGQTLGTAIVRCRYEARRGLVPAFDLDSLGSYSER